MLLQMTQLAYRNEYPIVVERQFNPNSQVRGFGETAAAATQKIWEQRRELGYWDAEKAYPQGQENLSVPETKSAKPEEAPKRGTGRQ
ncbi:hypothetical protein QUA40_12900 [Microcoleus sp. Pol11C3]|uniref:hypothetical protein n=1 Tax=Microcoleus sp. Pol11C3 TaxID=3055390 RepID=UPI002FCE84E8